MRTLLAEAVRLHFRPELVGAFVAAAERVGVPERLLVLADHAYALPCLASACRRAGLSLPDPAVEAALDAAFYHCAARSVAMRRVLEQVGDAFTAGGVPFLVLKGGALELLAPRTPGVRVTADLDVLVPRGRMAECEALLVAGGFGPRYAAHVEEFRRHSHHAVPYVSASGAGVVEIHETLAPRAAPVRLPVESLWERSLTVHRGGRKWRVPHLSDLALHTCVHYGLIHPYNTVLRRLWDLGVLSTLDAGALPAGVGGVDWGRVEALARRYGGRRVVRQARADLAWLLADAPDPEWPLFEAPYSGAAAFRLQQAAADTLWDRARTTWHFLLPGPHETAPVRNGMSHPRYLAWRLALGAWRLALGREEQGGVGSG